MRWEPAAARADLSARPPFLLAVGRGVRNRCPVCGEGRVFAGYLRVTDACTACAAPLGELRADDAPPYITIFLVGHLLLPVVLWVEHAFMPPMWLHMLVWLPLFAALCVGMLRPIKGGVVGWMSSMGMLERAEPERRDG